MALRINFETCNSAFGETDLEHRSGVVTLLLDVASRIARSEEEGPIMDANGNKVGDWSLDRGCRCEIGKVR